ncbi:MAG: Maf family protein [Beutenbergiaceae bacterium]
MPQVILASASPARTATLTAAGIAHRAIASDVDEDAVVAAARSDRGELTVAESVLLLARAKAESVAARQTADLIIGCDSLLEVDGEPMGKPGTADVARQRWRQVRGRDGVLNTGHWLILDDGRCAGATSRTTVRFADITDSEIDAYVATGEPLQVAGGFTIDGLGAAFISAVIGDPHGVVGISLPLLRELSGSLGISWINLWSRNGQASLSTHH